MTGTASSYDVRYSTAPITSSNWGSANQATGEPIPGAPGTAQSVTIRGLSRQVTYYFAARTTDDAGILVLDAWLSGFQQADRAEHAVEQIDRLEPGDHDRHTVVRGDGLVLPVSHHRAHMPRTEEAAHSVAWRLEHGRDGRRHENMRHEHREVRDAKRASVGDG